LARVGYAVHRPAGPLTGVDPPHPFVAGRAALDPEQPPSGRRLCIAAFETILICGWSGAQSSPGSVRPSWRMGSERHGGPHPARRRLRHDAAHLRPAFRPPPPTVSLRCMNLLLAHLRPHGAFPDNSNCNWPASIFSDRRPNSARLYCDRMSRSFSFSCNAASRWAIATLRSSASAIFSAATFSMIDQF
jgi:hypothetical protein